MFATVMPSKTKTLPLLAALLTSCVADVLVKDTLALLA
jgi:hypothetical protein